jgi:demethylmenaquinone methyltransferase/2-methoxy-6-polyprenyl-1,4-benzoquinol methylase
VADDLIQEQIAYYDARASEYDRMLSGEGRYDLDGLDPAAADRDTRELALVEAALKASRVGGDVLEIACGPGWWTKRLVLQAARVTALDASPRMLSICRERVDAHNVRLVEASVFDWLPDRSYDAVFFAFWLSHVPPDRFADFWAIVAAALKPGGTAFWVDEFEWDEADGIEEHLDDGRGATIRTLEDGRRFRMVKIYERPEDLKQRLAAIGWAPEVTAVGTRMYVGVATRN